MRPHGARNGARLAFRPARSGYAVYGAASTRCVRRSILSAHDAAGARTVSFWFHFDWRLPSGGAAPFEVVDVATLGTDDRIQSLHVVYDTVDVRPTFEAEVGHPSWRQSRSAGP